MSMVFDGGQEDPVISLTGGYGPAFQRLQDLPLSATVWVYVPVGESPAVDEPWTVWWFGSGLLSVSLQIVRSQSGQPQARARLRDYDTDLLVALGGTLSTGGWHCLSVVLYDDANTKRLQLFVDDAAKVEDSGSVAVDTTAWHTFEIGATRSTTETRVNATIEIEHMAIWNQVLADAGGGEDSDNHRMFDGRIPPKDAGDRGLGVGVAPDFAYWYLVGHRRNGLRVRGNTSEFAFGEWANAAPLVFNPASQEFVLRIAIRESNASSLPMWSANTPVMRYFSTQPINVLPRRLIHAPSRLQPHFFVFNGPTEGPMVMPEGTDDFRTLLPYYTDPNMTKMCNCDNDSTSEIGPLYGPSIGLVPYIPINDVALIAKRCADGLAVQDMTIGKGTGPGARYAGAVTMRGTGEGSRSHEDAKTQQLYGYVGPTPDGQYTGKDIGFPLELHPSDWVYGAIPGAQIRQAYWSAWYRQEGVRLNQIFMDRFWKALMQELDDRGLCYPLRAHFDYEGWVRDTTQLRYVNPDNPMATTGKVQVGAWPLIEADARYATEMLIYEIGGDGQPVHKTLDDLGAPTYDNAASFYDASNRNFATWWWKYQYPMRMQAAAEGIFPDLATYLPETAWANYKGFVADNPEYRHLDTQDNRAWNSAPRAITPGDLATPVLYTGGILPKLRGDMGGRLGYTLTEAVRDWHTSQIDACASSRAAKPIVPTYENARRILLRTDDGGATYDILYEVTTEDMRVQYEHGWRRGANECILFVFDTEGLSFDAILENVAVAQWLRDYVHTVPQNAQARTGRLGRVARRSL